MAAENPFLQLLSSEEDSKRLKQLFDEETSSKGEHDSPDRENSAELAAEASRLTKEQVSRVLESIFLLTARDSKYSINPNTYPIQYTVVNANVKLMGALLKNVYIMCRELLKVTCCISVAFLWS